MYLLQPGHPQRITRRYFFPVPEKTEYIIYAPVYTMYVFSSSSSLFSFDRRSAAASCVCVYTCMSTYVCVCVPPREFINNNALDMCIREIKPLLVRTYNIEFARVFMAGHDIYDVRHRRRVGQLLRPTAAITMRLLRRFR